MEYSSKSERKKVATITVLIVFILILLSTIAGITYALFTSGNDGKIGINQTSGKCKIDIVDVEGNSLVGDVLHFVAADKREKIYFEPGATYCTEGFMVKNIGNIPVNFRLYISEDERVDKETFEEAFELWITDDPSNMSGAEKITSFTDRLEVEQNSGTYYLAIKMKETAGNEFQNKTYSGIGITVYAIQGNVSVGE